MKFVQTGLLYVFGSLCLLSCNHDIKKTSKNEAKNLPNIVFVYLDDLGYGDVSAYGATELNTPNIDQLANEGMKFINGFATSATCTPSRYGVMTGKYPWRNQKAQILPGSAPLIIDTTEATLPKMLKESGYQTAIIGKWHLGLGYGDLNWNGHIAPGPNELGFDHSYIMAATQDRVPTVYIDNGYVDNLDPDDPIEVNYEENFEGEPTGYNNPEMVTLEADDQHNKTVINGIPRIGYMKGGESARWSDIDMADHFLEKVQTYLSDKNESEKPFFLMYTMQQPHVPRTPHPRFEGTTSMGARGDAIMEADWVVGELMKSLDEADILENTLVIFSSDNGPILADGYEDQAEELLGQHSPSGNLKGTKYSLFEAGTRVPFITYWKDKIEPGVSDALVSQIDLFSSLAALVENESSTTDSQNLLDVFLGKSKEGRKDIIIEAMTRTAYKKGDWVMIPPQKGPKIMWGKGIETAFSKKFQLYNLAEDPRQDNNLADSNPEKLAEMLEGYEAIISEEFQPNRIKK